MQGLCQGKKVPGVGMGKVFFTLQIGLHIIELGIQYDGPLKYMRPVKRS
jgi:hypothetical protein